MLSSGGSLTALGTAGMIDLPGDVALASGGSDLWVTGMNTSGEPAIFSVPTGGGGVTEEFAGAPLVDPLAIAANAAGTKVYVVDSMGQDGSGAVFAFDVPGFTSSVLAMNFRVEFPGGLAVDPDDMWLYYTQTNTTAGSTAPMTGPALVRIATDGSVWEVVSTAPNLVLPAGTAAISGTTYVSDVSSLALGDVFTYAY
jgi:DNA-binding beta-propeller fold protein YncE